jgi:hypothetical protein
MQLNTMSFFFLKGDVRRSALPDEEINIDAAGFAWRFQLLVVPIELL